MKKVIIVVQGGRVQTAFLPKDTDLEVEVVDFDGAFSQEEENKLGDYCDECRNTMKEVTC